MVAEGVLENPKPEAILGLHTSTGVTLAGSRDDMVTEYLEAGEVGWNSGPASANSDRFQIIIKGTMAHGSAPHKGVDAIMVAAQAINALQMVRARETNPQQPLVMTIGTIQGGQRENILADTVEMGGTVRTADEGFRDHVIELMNRTLKGVTEAHGATFELNYRKGYPIVMNDDALVKKLLPTMRRIVGDARVLEVNPGMGGEDFSYFAQKLPGFFYRLGCANEGKGITAGGHTPQFDVDEEALKTGVEVMAGMVCDLLKN